MKECVHTGIAHRGVLPGGLGCAAARRSWHDRCRAEAHGGRPDLRRMDWVSLFALAVNEENAAGGRVVTAPTNGAAGVIPAVLHYYADFCRARPTTESSASC